MSNLKRRLGSGVKSDGGPIRVTRVEYVNRAGQLVNPENGKPYDRPKQDPKQNGARSKGKKTYPVKTKGVIFGGLELIPTDGRIDPPPRVCFNCWQHGHSKAKCPRPVVAKICNNCGRRNVEVENCPRCHLAYKKFLESKRGQRRSGDILDGDFDEQLFPGEEEDYGNESSDDVLQNLIYQDERARAARQLEFERGREHDMRKDNQLYQNEYYERRYEEPRYIENPGSPLYQENMRNQLTKEEIYYSKDGNLRRYDDSSRRSYLDDNLPRLYRGERNREDSRRSESPGIDSGAMRGITSGSSSAELGDPVHEILELTKSISHLSPETQELIMLQVMSERRERAKLRAMQQKESIDDDPWA